MDKTHKYSRRNFLGNMVIGSFGVMVPGNKAMDYLSKIYANPGSLGACIR